MANQEDYQQKKRVTLIGTAINLILSVLKYVIGIIAGSSALIADATHSVSDYVSDLVVLTGLKFSSMPADKKHPYGHGKYETLATMAVGLTLFAAGGFLIYSGFLSLYDFFTGHYTIHEHYHWALIASISSIVFKEGLYQYTIYYGKKLNSSSLKANAYHHRSDSYSSIGVTIGIAFASISDSLAFMDPLSGIVVALLIIKMGWNVVVPTFDELVDAAVDEETMNKIKEVAEETFGVLGTSKLRSRLNGSELLIDLEIKVDPALSLYQAHDISEEVKGNIINLINYVKDIVVHIEPCENLVDVSAAEDKLFTKVNEAVRAIQGVDDVNRVRFHYIPGGIEVNLDVVVNENLTIKEGHKISDRIEEELIETSEIVLVHVHLEFENKFKKPVKIKN